MKNKKNELTKVALYIRVSTDRQAKEGDSLEAQEKALTDYAKEHNYIIIDKYIDGGESGQKIKRTNLQRLLKDCETKDIDLIIMTKLDRWFRNVADFYKVIEVLKKNKVDWKTIWEDYDTTTASGEFWLNMSLALGQMEAKRTGERISEIFEHKFKYQKTVCSGKKKFGYDISKEKKYIINNEEAEMIKDLYNYFINCESLNKTVTWFRENKKQLGHASIKIYLKDISYTGRYLRKKTNEIIDDFIPRIIDDETYHKAQSIFERNIKVRGNTFTEYKNNYIFSGLLRCKNCGSKLSATSNKNGTKYYRCKKYSICECNMNKMINEKKLETYLINNICSLIDQKLINVDIENIKIENNEKLIKTIKNKMQKLAELYLNDMIEIEYYKTEYNKLKQQLEMEQDKNNESTNNIENIKKIKKLLNNDFFTIYYSLSDTEKRELWGKVFNYLIVNIKNTNDFEVELIVD